jgi:tRNA pseudouridine55 synthase
LGDRVDGFLLVDKPIGMTSYDVVRRVKKRLKLDKIGHTGTLDPFASGLLILTIGKATKLSYLFSDSDKFYEGTILFGKHYDTYDVTGKVIQEDIPNFDEKTLFLRMKSFNKTYDQMPPMYSAIKKEGRKLYELARQGIDVIREKRTVTIHDFHATSHYINHEINFKAHVSKGTYIRSIAVDLANELNTFGALKTLNRTQIGSYLLKDAKPIDLLSHHDIIPIEVIFKGYPKLELNDYLIKLVKNGVMLDERQTLTKDPFVVVDKENNMIAYYEPIMEHKYAPVLIF